MTKINYYNNKKDSLSKNGFKVAYVGNFLNHGTTLAQYGTGLIYLLSKIDSISKIDVICPIKNNENVKDINIGKASIMELYDYSKPLTILKILSRTIKSGYDLIIFNINSTSFGEGSITNFFGLFSPVILKFFKKEVLVIYHNSVITNDVEKLGYNSIYDKFRKLILEFLETSIFKNVNTYATLNLYKDILNRRIKRNNVKAIKIKYIDAIPALILNEMENSIVVASAKIADNYPRILLYGYWGPQKDLEFALSTLSNLKSQGYKFHLTLSGGINNHFKGYQKTYDSLVKKYRNTINEIKGYVNEKDVADLFINSDLLLLSYSTPGGFSGVLDLAMFFETPVIGIAFPEYVEQAKGHQNVILVERENFESAVKNFMINFKNSNNKIINAKDKIEEEVQYLENLISESSNEKWE